MPRLHVSRVHERGDHTFRREVEREAAHRRVQRGLARRVDVRALRRRLAREPGPARHEHDLALRARGDVGPQAQRDADVADDVDRERLAPRVAVDAGEAGARAAEHRGVAHEDVDRRAGERRGDARRDPPPTSTSSRCTVTAPATAREARSRPRDRGRSRSRRRRRARTAARARARCPGWLRSRAPGGVAASPPSESIGILGAPIGEPARGAEHRCGAGRGRISASRCYDAVSRRCCRTGEQRSGGGSGRLELHSDLWLDQPDAHERIEKRLANDTVTADEAALLHGFVDVGYLKFSLGLSEEFCAGFDADVSRAVGGAPARPRDLAAGSGRTDVPRRLRRARARSRLPLPRPARALRPRPRALPRADDLPHDRAHLRPTRGRVPVALLRVRVAAVTAPRPDVRRHRSARAPARVVGRARRRHSGERPARVRAHDAPVALVRVRAGLGRVRCRRSRPRSARSTATGRARGCRREELEVQRFTCRRGDVFIWHAGLLHGGSPIDDAQQTRRSFVVHYCTAANKTARAGRACGCAKAKAGGTRPAPPRR